MTVLYDEAWAFLSASFATLAICGLKPDTVSLVAAVRLPTDARRAGSEAFGNPASTTASPTYRGILSLSWLLKMVENTAVPIDAQNWRIVPAKPPAAPS